MGLPGISERAGDSVHPDFRPLLSFLRRPAFTFSVPARLPIPIWVGWIGLLLLVTLLGSGLDRFVIQVFRWPAPGRSSWAYLLAHPSWLAFAILLVAPALEELTFRAFLSTAPKFVFSGLVFFAFSVYSFIQTNVPVFAARISAVATITGYFAQFWPVLPISVVSLLLYRYRRDAVLAFFRQRAGWVFWVSCILFGLGHGALYSNHLVWGRFALVMPQTLVGIGLAFMRVRFGLRWSVISHYALDILFVLPLWLHYWASWSWLDLSAASPLGGFLHGMLVAVTAVRFVLVAYGVVVLWCVARFRW